MENKLTAVEWLAEKMSHPEIFNPYIEQALQMEKKQIIDTFQDSRMFSITNNCNSGEQYYNEIFNK